MQKRGVSRLFVQNFLSQSTEKFRWGTLRCIGKFQVSKNFIHQRKGGITFLRRKLLSHSTEKFRWGTVRCFRKFRVSQNFMHKKGISLNSVDKFLSHSADKIRRTLLCFERILVSKNFKQRRAEASRFCRKFFYLTGPKKTSPGNHSVLFFRKFLVSKQFLWIRGGGEVSRFSVEKFLSHCTKTFPWRTLWCFRKFFYRKFSCLGGGGITVLSKFLVSQDRNEKLCKGTILFSRKFLVSKKNLSIRGRGGIKIFSRNFYVSQCRKIS